jgi:hypothetical protein
MPADPILTLAWLVFAHLVADFVVQTGGIVEAKNAPGSRGWQGLGLHAAGVAVCLVPVALAFGLPGLWTLVAITALHGIIDRTKILATWRTERRALDAADRRHEGAPPAAGLGRAWTPLPALYFALDQGAHLVAIVAAWAIWLAGQAPIDGWSSVVGNLFAGRDLAVVHEIVLGSVVALSLLIANVRAGALFVATLVRPNELGAEIGAIGGEAIEPAEPAEPAEPIGPVEPDATVEVLEPGAPPRPESSSWSFRIGPLEGRVSEEPASPGPLPSPGAAPATEPPVIPQPAQVGATIGVLERLLIVGFLLVGAEAAIGLVVAAKTIARFRLLDDRDFAEYYLLGTLGSVTVALVTGLLAKAALGL